MNEYKYKIGNILQHTESKTEVEVIFVDTNCTSAMKYLCSPLDIIVASTYTRAMTIHYWKAANSLSPEPADELIQKYGENFKCFWASDHSLSKSITQKSLTALLENLQKEIL